MNPAFCDYISILESEIASSLISPDCLQRIQFTAQQLPNALTPLLGFECRLDEADANADFAVCVEAHSKGQHVLCGDRLAVQLPDIVQQSPIWQQIRKFSQAWVSEASPLYPQIRNLWLKFDVDDSTDTILSPSCCFTPQPIYSSAQDTNALPNAGDQHTAYNWITHQALHHLLGQELPKTVQHQLFHCIDWLPENAHVAQIGAMPARNSNVIRLCLGNLTPDHLLDYLERIQWSGSLPHLRSLLTTISGLVDRINLALNIGATILPQLELECYLDRQPLAEPRWPLFLDYLVVTNLCLPEKRDGLLNFPGHIRQSHHPDQWSTHLTMLSQILGTNYEVIFLKGLQHIKLVYEGDAAIAAQAHLTVVKTVLDKHVVKQFVPLALGIV